MTYDNNNTGALFRNVKKQPGDRLPDYRGMAEVNGEKLEISAWINVGKKDGKKFMKLVFQQPLKKSDPGAFVPPPPKQNEADEEVPF